MDGALFAAVLALGWAGPHFSLRGNPVWLGACLLLSGGALACLFCGRLLWRSMGPWAIAPGLALGLLLYASSMIGIEILTEIW